MTSYLLTLLASILIVLLTALAIAVLPWSSKELKQAEQELSLIWDFLTKKALKLKVLLMSKSSIQQPS